MIYQKLKIIQHHNFSPYQNKKEPTKDTEAHIISIEEGNKTEEQSQLISEEIEYDSKKIASKIKREIKSIKDDIYKNSLNENLRLAKRWGVNLEKYCIFYKKQAYFDLRKKEKIERKKIKFQERYLTLYKNKNEAQDAIIAFKKEIKPLLK